MIPEDSTLEVDQCASLLELGTPVCRSSSATASIDSCELSFHGLLEIGSVQHGADVDADRFVRLGVVAEGHSERLEVRLEPPQRLGAERRIGKGVRGVYETDRRRPSAPKRLDLVEDRVEVALPHASQRHDARRVVLATARAALDLFNDLAAVVRARRDHEEVALGDLLANGSSVRSASSKPAAAAAESVEGLGLSRQVDGVTSSPSRSSSASAWVWGKVRQPLQWAPSGHESPSDNLPLGARLSLREVAPRIPPVRRVSEVFGDHINHPDGPVFEMAPSRPLRRNRATGAFVIVDEATNDTVGAGMIL